MVTYNFKISESGLSKFFYPVKNKTEIIKLLMNTIKHMMINPLISESETVAEIHLTVDKMSRLFFIKDNKCFSIVFPFNVSMEKIDDLVFYRFLYKNTLELDHKLTSDIIAVINDPSFDSSCGLEFIDTVFNYQGQCEEYWLLLKDLMLMEDGYLRYDFDPDNYYKHKKSGIHPLNHYDLFYTSNATFKIGLNAKINYKKFHDLLNVKTKCRFLV